MNKQENGNDRSHAIDHSSKLLPRRTNPARVSIWILTERPERYAHVLELLRAELFDVHVTIDGWRTYYEAMVTPPKILLVDGSLNCMDAIAFCCLVKSSKWLFDLPLIFIDTEASSGMRVRALSAGASDCITFPFLAEELIARFRIQLRRLRRPDQEMPEEKYRSSTAACSGCTISAINLIKSGNIGKLNTKSIARHVGASNRRLESQFKETIGITVSDYLRSERMRRAAWLLRHTGITVSAVAREVGFRSPCNFSVAFKRCTGMSPSDFRVADISDESSFTLTRL